MATVKLIENWPSTWVWGSSLFGAASRSMRSRGWRGRPMRHRVDLLEAEGVGVAQVDGGVDRRVGAAAGGVGLEGDVEDLPGLADALDDALGGAVAAGVEGVEAVVAFKRLGGAGVVLAGEGGGEARRRCWRRRPGSAWSRRR